LLETKVVHDDVPQPQPLSVHREAPEIEMACDNANEADKHDVNMEEVDWVVPASPPQSKTDMDDHL